MIAPPAIFALLTYAPDGMEKVVCVSSAKVPIVKIWDPELELSCDMNVNNTLALENTRMIKTYVHIDDRVRALAMIIKYWTRRRILNDAAFGGTLSSYTWICMIIAFLQLRQPPVLPALHQRPHQKLPRQDGEIAAFADDVEKLQGFGDQNKSTLGELLFEFFRFFAHEFDYSTNALSVRLGKLITKNEKKWHLTLNNQLCVEEPFNINRNLGNTADDTAFRGIHLELRRAFNAIARGNLGECCEQYIYPKEEERIFQKPPTVSRPVLLRSASQQQSSRPSRGGGYRNGNRHQNRNNGSHNNNNNNSRRASSGLTYENAANPMYISAAYAMALGAQDAAPLYMHTPEIAAQISALQLQENNLRFLQYTHSQAFAQQQALQHAQRMQGNTPQPQSSTERSRTNSFDTPPLSAPLRPDMRPELYYYQVPIQQAHAFYGLAAYPSMPSNIVSTDYRRTSHRSTAASETGHGSSGSTIRSHSQPASRPITVVPSTQNLGVPGQMPNGFTSAPACHANVVPVPSFISDDARDNEPDGSTADSLDDGKSSSHYTNHSTPPSASVPTNGLPVFGDISSQSEASTRHLSNGFAQHVPDGMSISSRSPSPNYQETLYSRSSGAGPSVAATFSPTHLARDSVPLVVNGSRPGPILNNSPRQAWYGETGMASDLAAYENPLHIHQETSLSPPQPASASDQSFTFRKANSPGTDRPVIVNGSRPTSGFVTPPHPGSHFTSDAVTANPDGTLHVATWPTGAIPGGHVAPPIGLQATLQRFPRPVPSPLIAQLDLATETNPHLSPVYERNSPSPSFTRKLELPSGEASNRPAHSSQKRRDGASEFGRFQPKSLLESPTPGAEGPSHVNPRINGLIKENGHIRGAKSESDNAGTNGAWQKPRGRKRVNELKGRNETFSQSEQPPRNDADRKGG
jgi:DNA polymerase sigma